MLAFGCRHCQQQVDAAIAIQIARRYAGHAAARQARLVEVAPVSCIPQQANGAISGRHQDDVLIGVVVQVGDGNIERAVKAIQMGAADFIPKPFEAANLDHVVARVLEVAPGTFVYRANDDRDGEGSGGDSIDDEYAEYRVPDDLTW